MTDLPTPSRASGVEPRTNIVTKALHDWLGCHHVRVRPADGWMCERGAAVVAAALRQGTPEDGLRLIDAVRNAGYDPLGMLTNDEWDAIAREYAALPSTTEGGDK